MKRCLKRVVISTMVFVLAACAGGADGVSTTVQVSSPSSVDLVPTDTSEMPVTVTSNSELADGGAAAPLVVPTSRAEFADAVTQAERDVRARLLAAAVPSSTPDDAIALNDEVAAAVAGLQAVFVQPVGLVRLPVGLGVGGMAVPLGLAFQSPMDESGSAPVGSNESLKTTITVEGSRLTIEMVMHLEFTTADGTVVSLDATGNASGDVCPDASGQVVIDVALEEHISGAGLSAHSSIAATGTAIVGGDAEVASFSIDLRSGIDAQAVDGSNGFLEYVSTVEQQADGLHRTSRDISREVRADQINGAADMTGKLDNVGQLVATMALDGATKKWRNGFCVEVVSSAPDRVKPGSTTDIDVSVHHRFEGSELDAPVDVTLSGKDSIDPERIDNAPGQISYVAPDENKTQASITFKSTSNRGIGELASVISIRGQRYEASGGGDELTVSGTVDDLATSFQLSGQFTGGTATFSFSPSNDRAGSVTYAGGGSGVTVSGSGAYSITGPEDGPLTMTMTTEGCVKGIAGTCRNSTATITLTPLD